MWTQARIATRCHLSCRIPDRYVVSPVASWIIVAESGSGALQRLGPLQKRGRIRIRIRIVAAGGVARSGRSVGIYLADFGGSDI